MIDTVRLTQIATMHAPSEMLELGFSPNCGHARRGARPAKWTRNVVSIDEARPRETWTAARDGLDYLSAEVSLPKLLYRSNAVMLQSDEQVETALRTLSQLVSETAQVHFDAASSLVGRVDFCCNWKLRQQSEVYDYISALRSATMPRMTRRITGDSTVDFSNRSQTVVIYSKLDDVFNQLRVGHASGEDLQWAVGLLRLEARFRTAASCRRLAAQLRLANRTAGTLLNFYVATSVLEVTMRNLCLDMTVDSGDSREARLREFYGVGPYYVRLLGFLWACEAHGAENMVRLGVCSRADYHRKVRDLKRAGVWLMCPSKRRLTPLRLVSPV